MQRQTNDPKMSSGRREFLKSAGTLAAGLYLASGNPLAGAEEPSTEAKKEVLAVKGGSPAVTYPAEKRAVVFKWPPYGDTEKEAVKAALDCDSGGFYRYGPRLEAKWREYNGVPFAKTHINGTSAITSMFFALDLPPGSEIMTPSYTFFGAILPMRLFGYVPVFVDINPHTATFDVEHARKVITPKTRALVAMHSWGLPCEMDLINDFAREHDLIVMEDCAHAHGASMQGKKVGNFGQMGIYSFQATKPLTGIEGGMGVYQNRKHFERATAFGHYEECGTYVPGSPTGAGSLAQDSPYRKYTGTGLGMKLRMHPLAAVILLKQMEKIDKQNAIINTQVRKLNDRICRLPGLSEPVCRKDQDRVYYNGNMLFLDEKQAGISRDKLIKALVAEGVSAFVWEYPENHKFTVYSEPQWWHHPPQIPKTLSGCQEVNSRSFNVPLLRREAPELVEQYINAFEKIWANRKELA
jgi:perosamine synthetase